MRSHMEVIQKILGSTKIIDAYWQTGPPPPDAVIISRLEILRYGTDQKELVDYLKTRLYKFTGGKTIYRWRSNNSDAIVFWEKK